MQNLANTPENNAKIAALKKVKETQWTGEETFENIEKALFAINYFLMINGGLYKPVATRINGLHGAFMINEDKGLCWEARIIKVKTGCYRVEYLRDEVYNDFENNYLEALEG